MSPVVAILHGVNLGMLGQRDPAQYGTLTLAGLEARIAAWGAEAGLAIACHQTDFEGEYVSLLHRYRTEAAAVIVNPGAWTHYAYAIRDAAEMVVGPVVEVHLSNIHAREAFRRHSFTAEVAVGLVSGFGADSYLLGLQGALSYLATHPSRPTRRREAAGRRSKVP